MYEHQYNAYPNNAEKLALAKEAGLTIDYCGSRLQIISASFFFIDVTVIFKLYNKSNLGRLVLHLLYIDPQTWEGREGMYVCKTITGNGQYFKFTT